MTIEFLVAYVTTAFEEAIDYYNELAEIPNPFIFQDDMLFESQFIKIKVVPGTKKYYECLFGEVLSVGQELDIPVGWLTRRSNESVSVICPRCEEVREAKFQNLIRNGHSFCWACAKQKKYDWMLGQVFGRLTILRFGSGILDTDGRTFSTFICKCECGNEVEVRANSLRKGNTTSCGCYHKERVSNPNLTDEERIIKRNVPENKEWRKAVYERDNYTCQSCGKTGEKLAAHHILPYAIFKDLRFDVSNGITLCRKCHKGFHLGFLGGYKVECNDTDLYRFVLHKRTGRNFWEYTPEFLE